MENQELNNINAFNMGWQHAHDDKLPDCPFSEHSSEAQEWWAGYQQACQDS